MKGALTGLTLLIAGLLGCQSTNKNIAGTVSHEADFKPDMAAHHYFRVTDGQVYRINAEDGNIYGVVFEGDEDPLDPDDKVVVTIGNPFVEYTIKESLKGTDHELAEYAGKQFIFTRMLDYSVTK